MKKLVCLVVVVVFCLGVTAVSAEVDCDINKGHCSKSLPVDNVTVNFDINPKPVKFMQELTFKITILQNSKPVTDANVTLDLNMPGMFMGKNKPTIKHVKDGVYEGKGVIPKCPSGRKVWRADITIERANKTARVDFTFEGM